MIPRKARPKYTFRDGVTLGLLIIPLMFAALRAPAFLPLVAMVMFLVAYPQKPSAKS